MSSSIQPIETVAAAANGDDDSSKKEKRGGIFFLTSTLFTANILGYSFSLSMFQVFLVGLVSVIPFTEWQEQNVPQVSPLVYFGYFWVLPISRTPE